jgi:hypothetical protein
VAGLIVFGFMAADGAVWDAKLGQCLDVSNTECRNRLWLPIGGTALIVVISAAFVGSMFSVAWEGVTFAGEIKTQNAMWA